MRGLLRSIALGAALPVLGMVALLILIRAPWALVAFGVALAIVWPAHARWLHAQRARAGEGTAGPRGPGEPN